MTESDPWDVFLEGCKEISEAALPEREQPPLEIRDLLIAAHARGGGGGAGDG